MQHYDTERGQFPPWLNTTLYPGKVLTGYMWTGNPLVYDRDGLFYRLMNDPPFGLKWVTAPPVCLIRIKLKADEKADTGLTESPE